MRTETMAKLALTVAAASLIGNYLQFVHARSKATSHATQITRLHPDHQIRAMKDRADAFYSLALGKSDSAPYSEKRGVDATEYKIEYAVRVPEQRQQECIQWMAAAKRKPDCDEAWQPHNRSESARNRRRPKGPAH